jgi:hypothetical protein
MFTLKFSNFCGKIFNDLVVFSEWLALLLLFRLRVLLGENSGSAQFPELPTKYTSTFFFWLGGT